MKSVLVTGANGFVGRQVCTSLRKRGVQVRALVRTTEAVQRLPEGVEPFLAAAPEEVGSWAQACRGQSAVVHLIGMTHSAAASSDIAAFRRVNVDITRSLLAACRSSGVERFLYMSSVKAMGNHSPPGSMYTESTECSPVDAYGRSKREAELLVIRLTRKDGPRPTILRPPIVYGPGVVGNFQRLLRLAYRGVPLPLRSVCNRRSIIYVNNLANAVSESLCNRSSDGEIFLVADESPISTPDLLRTLARKMGRAVRLFPMPSAALRVAGSLLHQTAAVDKLTGDLIVSTDHIKDSIGWRAPYSSDAGLSETVAWFLEQAQTTLRGSPR